MFPAQVQLNQIVRLLDASAPNFPTQFTARAGKDLYFGDAIVGLVEHFGQTDALGFPWAAAEAKEQLVQFTEWYAAFAYKNVADYCKVKTQANADAASAKNVKIARVNKARKTANKNRATNKQLPQLKYEVPKKVLKMPLVELVALTLLQEGEMAVWPVAKFLLATYQVQSMTQAQIESMFSHLKRMVSKYRHALKQANQDRCMAILENGPDGPACSTSGHVYPHEEFFNTAVKIWIQQHARKLVAGYNQDDWLPTASYSKEWGASLRSTKEGKEMLVEYKAQQVRKFNLLHKKRKAAKVEQQILECAAAEAAAAAGPAESDARRTVTDADDGKPQRLLTCERTDADDGTVMAYRVCVTEPGPDIVPALNDEVAFRWLPPSGKPYWATAKVCGIKEGQNVDGSATSRLATDPKPYVVLFEMDHEPVDVALRTQDYLKKWVYLVEHEEGAPRELQTRGSV